MSRRNVVRPHINSLAPSAFLSVCIHQLWLRHRWRLFAFGNSSNSLHRARRPHAVRCSSLSGFDFGGAVFGLAFRLRLAAPLGRLGVTLFGMVALRSNQSFERTRSAAASGFAGSAWCRAAQLQIR